MKRLDKYYMQDFISKESGEKRFCILAVDLEKDDFGPYKNFMIFYKTVPTTGNTHLMGTFVSDSALKRNFKWLKTDSLRAEALTWTISIPFEKGLELGNENHDIGEYKDLYERFGSVWNG